MTLSGIKAITIPEGAVKQIVSGGRVLWKGGVDVAALAIGYTGAYTDQAEVTMSGKKYRLLTLTGSGTLTVDANVKADVWLCSGGNGGKAFGCSGGGGGNIAQSNGTQLDASTVCVVGAGGTKARYAYNEGYGGATSFGSLSAAQSNANVTGSDGKVREGRSCGASGGGGASRMNNYDSYTGIGGGVSTVPFLESGVFDQHSAGGGGGGLYDRSSRVYYDAGAGGSNGANGAVSVSGDSYGGAGGTKGGGKGGNGSTSTDRNGGDATFYGSGGGGGGEYWDKNDNDTSGDGGAGYQGVIYVRIPYEQ